MIRPILLAVSFLSVVFCLPATAAELKTRNVVLIVSDGLRWQDVFNGADPTLMGKAGGVKETNILREKFWRDTPQARREALLPFFWTHIAKHGQLLGNQARSSIVKVSNGKNFSYPGYNEMITGIPDPRVDSNDKKLNLNTNVFEWLNERPQFKNKVAVFGTWDVFPYIFNIERSRLPIWPAWDARFLKHEIEPPRVIAELRHDTTPIWESVIQDAFLFHAAMNYVNARRPRVLFVGFGETDEWAHSGRYDMYLHAANHMDRFVRTLWETMQSKSQYRDKTTFIITADHGRGTGTEDWKSHGEKTAGSEGDWIAIIGPDTPALGERERTPTYTHSQIAATVAALLGHDFQAASPRSGAAITELIGRSN